MGKRLLLWIMDLQIDFSNVQIYLVSTSDILSIVFGVAATALGAGAIWATRQYNRPTTRGKLLFFLNFMYKRGLFYDFRKWYKNTNIMVLQTQMSNSASSIMLALPAHSSLIPTPPPI
jgi:hypothetical protein